MTSPEEPWSEPASGTEAPGPEPVERDEEAEKDEQADTVRRRLEETIEVLDIAAALLDGTGEAEAADSPGKAATAEQDDAPGEADDADEPARVRDLTADEAATDRTKQAQHAADADVAGERVDARLAPRRPPHPVAATEQAERRASPDGVPGPDPALVGRPSTQRAGIDEPVSTRSRMSRHDVLVIVVVGLLVAIVTFDVIMWLDRRAAIRATLSVAREAVQPSPPANAPAQGVYTEVTLLASGDLQVQQWLRSRTFLTGISLQAPSDPLLVEEVRASGLRVSADGRQVEGPSEVASSPVRLTFAWSQVIHLSYRLSGVLVRSASEPDQALARVTSIDIDYEPGGDPVVVSLRGSGVLGLLCAENIAHAPPQPCGRRVAGGWEVSNQDPTGSYRVIAQLDLSRSE